MEEPIGGTAATHGAGHDNRGYIAVFQSSVDADSAARDLGRAHGFSAGAIYRHAIRGMLTPGLSGAARAAIEADARVAYVEADQEFHASARQPLTTHVERSLVHQAVAIDGVDNDCDGQIDADDSDCGICLPLQATCGSNAECCSNKCRGSRGSKSCR